MFIGTSKYDYKGLGSKLSATAYKTYSISFEEEDSKNLKKEIEEKDILISNVKVRKEVESQYNNNVYFRDPLNGAYVNAGLSLENIERLKEVFGENALKTEGKNILLKGKVEEF